MPPRPPPPDVPLIDATAKSTSGTGNSIGGRDSSGNASVKVGLGQGIALLNSLLRHPAVRRKYDHMERSAMASMTEAVGDRGDAASAMADKGTQVRLRAPSGTRLVCAFADRSACFQMPGCLACLSCTLTCVLVRTMRQAWRTVATGARLGVCRGRVCATSTCRRQCTAKLPR